MFFIIFREIFKIKVEMLKMRDRTKVYNMLIKIVCLEYLFLILSKRKVTSKSQNLTQSGTELLNAVLVYSVFRKKKILFFAYWAPRGFENEDEEDQFRL